MLNIFQGLHAHIRNTLVWFIVYFIMQTIIWAAMAVLVILYPQTLFILVSVFFILLAALNIYLILIFARYLWKLRKLKNKLSFD